MLVYFYLFESDFLQRCLAALGECRLTRSFGAGRDLFHSLLKRGAPTDSLLHAALQGLAFDRHIWHALVGECLIYGADDMPRVPIDPRTLCTLVEPQKAIKKVRAEFPLIQQALYGSRDLALGATIYRPDHVGLNAVRDVERLASWLGDIDPDVWSPSALSGLAEFAQEEDRAEELAQVRDWWPAFVEMYTHAAAKHLEIVCERTD